MQTAATAYLTSNAQALALLHKAAAIEECRFNIDFSMDFSQSAEGMRMPHLAPLRQAARLLELEALMKVEEGKPDEAAGAIMASPGEARSLWNEPLYNSQLVRLSVDSTSLSSLERVLSRTVLGDAQLAKISQAAASEDNPGGLLRMMVGERCEGEALTPYVKSEFRPVTYVLYKFSGMEAQDHAMYLKLMAELVSAAGGSQEDMLDRPKKVEKEMRRLPKRFVMAKMLVVAVPDAFELQLKAFARLRAARAGIAVERFRLANGRLPDSLDELPPKWLDTVPTDPFDDKPIRYKKLTQGFVTYSIGPDLKDDGGKERDPKNYSAPFDITFIVAR
jgi:hypothetical protein